MFVGQEMIKGLWKGDSINCEIQNMAMSDVYSGSVKCYLASNSKLYDRVFSVYRKYSDLQNSQT